MRSFVLHRGAMLCSLLLIPVQVARSLRLHMSPSTPLKRKSPSPSCADAAGGVAVTGFSELSPACRRRLDFGGRKPTFRMMDSAMDTVEADSGDTDIDADVEPACILQFAELEEEEAATTEEPAKPKEEEQPAERTRGIQSFAYDYWVGSGNLAQRGVITGKDGGISREGKDWTSTPKKQRVRTDVDHGISGSRATPSLDGQTNAGTEPSTVARRVFTTLKDECGLDLTESDADSRRKLLFAYLDPHAPKKQKTPWRNQVNSASLNGEECLQRLIDVMVAAVPDNGVGSVTCSGVVPREVINTLVAAHHSPEREEPRVVTPVLRHIWFDFDGSEGATGHHPNHISLRAKHGEYNTDAGTPVARKAVQADIDRIAPMVIPVLTAKGKMHTKKDKPLYATIVNNVADLVQATDDTAGFIAARLTPPTQKS